MAQSIRNSTGKLKATSKGVDNGPNYLRASTGSCHDVCKYGTPHEFKPKPKRPVRRSSTSNAEIPIEIFTPSDKKSAKAVKSSSVAPEASVSTKLEAAVSGRSTSVGASKSVRQQASSSTKVSSSRVSKQMGQGSSLDVKSLSPDVSDLIKQESSLHVKSLSPDLSNLGKQESSLDVNSLSPDSVHKRDSSFVEQASSPESSTSVKQESSLDVRSSPPNPLISVKQESSSDVKVKSPSIPSIKKGSSSQRQSRPSASKSTIQDVQSRRKSSLSHVSGLSVGQSASKPTRYSLHLTPGSTSKTSIVGRKSSSLDASKSVKREASSSRVKAPLKNDTSTKLVGASLKSKSNHAKIEQSSPSNMLGSKSGDGSSGKINSGSKIGTDSRTSKAASKKIMDSTTTSLPLKTRKSLASSGVALTPNLPGTKVARLNVRSSITKEEGSSSSRKAEASSLSSSSSKKPEKEKVPEKTLHMIEMETSNQQSPGSFDSLCQSKSAFSSQDAIETDSESEYTDSEADDTVSSYRRGSGKGRVMDNGSAAVKLKFRRGKVVDLESEANSPKRLRFRRKSISEDERSVENEMKIVLRHQDLQEKRSEKGLLNVVIEETASKLEETRKSKVKALVGAFESVISLQESKPSPNLSPGR